MLDILDTMDLIEIYGKVLDLYSCANDFIDKKTGKPQFTNRTKILIHQIASLCHRSPVLNRHEHNARKLAYMEKRTPEQILVDMVFTVTSDDAKEERYIEYITPMICCIMIDELLRRRDEENRKE